MKRLLSILALWLLCTEVMADCLSALRLTGVNLAGGEFNESQLPGEYTRDYIYPGTKELDFVAAQGANLIRLPFRWERLRPDPKAGLDATEVARLQLLVSQAQARGLCVLLDMHNFARYYSRALDQDAELPELFIDTWQQIAKVFSDPRQTMLGLMNEPAHMAQHQWNLLAKRTLAQLREHGSQHWILLSGGNWDGLHDWFVSRDGYSNADDLDDLSDPLKRSAIEVHQYADSNYSGTSASCLPAAHFAPLFARISDWAQINGLQLFLGEFGFASSAECSPTFTQFLQSMEQSPWLGWTYWAGGPWWAADYPFRLNSDSQAPSPQWAMLKPYFALRPLPPQSRDAGSAQSP